MFFEHIHDFLYTCVQIWIVFDIRILFDNKTLTLWSKPKNLYVWFNKKTPVSSLSCYRLSYPIARDAVANVINVIKVINDVCSSSKPGKEKLDSRDWPLNPALFKLKG